MIDPAVHNPAVFDDESPANELLKLVASAGLFI